MGVMVAVGRCGERGPVTTLCELFTTVSVASVSRPPLDDDTYQQSVTSSIFTVEKIISVVKLKTICRSYDEERNDFDCIV